MLTINFSIIGISETWLNEDTKNTYNINGYNSEHLCRVDKRGGGVSIFIQEGIQYSRRTDLDIINDYVEAIFIEINKVELNTKKDLIVGVIYRPPNTDLQKFLDIINDWVSPMDKEKTINFYLGD